MPKRKWTPAQRKAIGAAVKAAAARRKLAKDLTSQVPKSLRTVKQKKLADVIAEKPMDVLVGEFLSVLEDARQEAEDEIAQLEDRVEQLENVIEAIRNTDIG